MPQYEEITVPSEYGTFLTPAGRALIAASMRNANVDIEFVDVVLGSGNWAITENNPAIGDTAAEIDYSIQVPDNLISPIEGARYEINELRENGVGITQGIVIIPASDGPFTVTEAAWRISDGTVFAITRYPPMPKLTPADGVPTDMRLRANLLVGTAANVVLQVDPSVIQASQEYVDNAVGDVGRTTSQSIVQLQAQMSQLPVSYLVTPPVVGGDSEEAYGNSINLSASGSVSAWQSTTAAASIEKYVWMVPGGTALEGTSLSYPLANDPALAGDELKFWCYAVDTLGNRSPAVEHTVTIVGNLMPRMTGFTHTVPESYIKGGSKSVSFTGAVDPDGEDGAITYKLSELHNIVFSKTNGIAQGESITATFATVTEDSPGSFKITAVDGAGIESVPVTVNFTVMINELPDISGLVHTVPSEGVRGASYDVTFSGAVDPDGDDAALVYEISSTSNISFSKASGIGQNEVISATFADVADGTPVFFAVRSVDANGGVSGYANINSATVDPVVGVNGGAYSGGSIINDGKGVKYELTDNATSSQAFSFLVPDGVTRLRGIAVGGGGAASLYHGGFGGGGGGIEHEFSVTPGETISVIVGSGAWSSGDYGTQPSGGTSSISLAGVALTATGGRGASGNNDSGSGGGGGGTGSGPEGSLLGTGGRGGHYHSGVGTDATGSHAGGGGGRNADSQADRGGVGVGVGGNGGPYHSGTEAGDCGSEYGGGCGGYHAPGLRGGHGVVIFEWHDTI